MTLVKKTVVLYKDKTKGYINVIRLGESAGAKVVLNDGVKDSDAFWIILKTGDNPLCIDFFRGERAEFEFPAGSFSINDNVSAIVLTENGNVYARGGRYDLINMKEAYFTIEKKKAEGVSQKEPEQEEEQMTITAQEPDAIIDTAEDQQAVLPITNQNDKTESEYKKDTVTEPQAVNSKLNDEKNIKTSQINIEEKKTKSEKSDTQTIQNTYDNEKIKVSPETMNDMGAACKINADKVEVEITPPEAKTNPFNVPKGENFYQSIRTRLDDIMTIHPREERLEKLIPDSKWVKVKYDGEDYYVVGILMDDGVITHIAYGVPGLQKIKPPKEAENLCDFLPLPDGNGAGFWLMFQDPRNGEIIKN